MQATAIIIAALIATLALLVYFFLQQGLYRAEQYANIFGALLGFIGTAIALTLVRSIRQEGAQGDTKSQNFSERVDRLRTNLSESGALIQELEAEMTVRAAALERLRVEAEDNRRLAAMHKEEAEAVARLVEAIHEKGNSRSRREQLLLFGAGLATAVPFGVVGNFAYDALTK